MNLSAAKLLAPPGTGTTSLNEIMSQFQHRAIPHDHTLRIDPTLPGTYVMTIRDPVKRMISGWKFRLYKRRSKRTWIDSGDLNEFAEAFVNTSHHLHLQSQRVYWNSVHLPLPPTQHRVVSFGEPFLVSQTDFLRGLNHSIHHIHFVCTENIGRFALSLNQSIVQKNVHSHRIANVTGGSMAIIRRMYNDDDSLHKAHCERKVEPTRYSDWRNSHTALRS